MFKMLSSVRPWFFNLSMAAKFTWSFVWLDSISDTRIWKRLSYRMNWRLSINVLFPEIVCLLWWTVNEFTSGEQLLLALCSAPMTSTGAFFSALMVRMLSNTVSQFSGTQGCSALVSTLKEVESAVFFVFLTCFLSPFSSLISCLTFALSDSIFLRLLADRVCLSPIPWPQVSLVPSWRSPDTLRVFRK